jgi:hypothetical protein
LNPNKRTAANAANVYWEASTGVFYRSTSSLRYKSNVQSYTAGLADVMRLRPVSFTNKADSSHKTFAGFIAEEIHDLGLNEFVEYDLDGRPDSVAYANLTALLASAMQEQQAVITTLTKRVAALESN